MHFALQLANALTEYHAALTAMHDANRVCDADETDTTFEATIAAHKRFSVAIEQVLAIGGPMVRNMILAHPSHDSVAPPARPAPPAQPPIHKGLPTFEVEGMKFDQVHVSGDPSEPGNFLVQTTYRGAFAGKFGDLGRAEALAFLRRLFHAAPQ